MIDQITNIENIDRSC